MVLVFPLPGCFNREKWEKASACQLLSRVLINLASRERAELSLFFFFFFFTFSPKSLSSSAVWESAEKLRECFADMRNSGRLPLGAGLSKIMTEFPKCSFEHNAGSKLRERARCWPITVQDTPGQLCRVRDSITNVCRVNAAASVKDEQMMEYIKGPRWCFVGFFCLFFFALSCFSTFITNYFPSMCFLLAAGSCCSSFHLHVNSLAALADWIKVTAGELRTIYFKWL